MNIKQALKRKNKLVLEINQEFQKVQRYNSVIDGVERVYDPTQAFDDFMNKTNKLVELKTAIHKANLPVYHLIFRLSELKSTISKIRSLDCDSGQIYQRGGYGSADSTIVKTAKISIVERDQTIEKLEAEIEKIQDELDAHNATTQIDWVE